MTHDALYPACRDAIDSNSGSAGPLLPPLPRRAGGDPSAYRPGRDDDRIHVPVRHLRLQAHRPPVGAGGYRLAAASAGTQTSSSRFGTAPTLTSATAFRAATSTMLIEFEPALAE